MGTLHSRIIAEHLSTLASLLESEAIRVNALGLKGSKSIAREAMDVRRMANQLWEADIDIDLERNSEHIASGRQAMSELPAASQTGMRICS
ncbi:hypothetical protein Q8A64_09885 [Oxalobacteraceae bacterium R-40]|uniref:Uncharacterized protein n=1 Tax=Keguizhuia sedimenti TaxID=3064264 RepID=A0ABU1BNY0_9BURK|nr:hypothetical protein [Oxalobacteraceae bacterium R-40]